MIAKPKANLIIPCLNEATVLPIFLAECIDVLLNDVEVDWKIIVVDNASEDDSAQICRELNIEVLNCSKRGYGATLNHGISQSEVEWVTYADADGTYNPRDAVKLVKFAIENNADLVLGSRMKGVMEPGSITLFSRLGTPIISLLIKKLFRIPLTDCNSGIRCLRRSIYDSLKMASTGMEFASELVIKTAIMDLKYFEIPVNLRRCPSPDRKPHIRILRDGLRHLGIIILLFVKNLRNNVK